MRLLVIASILALAVTLSTGASCEPGEAANFLFIYHTYANPDVSSNWRAEYTNRMSAMLSYAVADMDIDHSADDPSKYRIGVITHGLAANTVLDMNDKSVNTQKAISSVGQIQNGSGDFANVRIGDALSKGREMLDQRLAEESGCGLYVVIFIGQAASNKPSYHGPLTIFVDSLLSDYPDLGDRISFGTIASEVDTVGWMNPHTNPVTSAYLALTYTNPSLYPATPQEQEEWGLGLVSNFCVNPEWYGCDVPEAASRATGFGSLEYLGPVLAVVGLIALVIAAALFSASSKIEAPERYPQYSTARRDFVAQSVKGGAAAPPNPENVESSSMPLAKSSSPMAEPGPIVSRTMTLIVAVVILAIIGGHVTLFRSFGGVWALMSLIAGLLWLGSCGLAIYAFMGNNAFTNWNLVTKVVFGLDSAILLTALVLLFTQAQSLVDGCTALCDQMPEEFSRNACVSACPQSVGAVMLGPLITTVLILGAGGFVLSQTIKAEAGNGRVMSFGGVFPTETGFKGVAKVRPPPGGSHGSRGSNRGSGRQAPTTGSRGSKRGSSRR